MRGHRLAILVLAGAVGLAAFVVTAPAGIDSLPALGPRAALGATGPGTAPDLKKIRKLSARLDKCQRRLISCHEKRDLERNQITFRAVLGGLGWIFGLCGLGLAVAVLWRDRQRRVGG
jgi:hypothetical protein